MNEAMETIAREGKQLRDRLPDTREALGAARTRLRALDTRTRALVQERPLMAIATAVAVGFVLRRVLPFGR